MKRILFAGLVAFAALVIYSCSKSDNNNSGGKARMQVYLTDDPGAYDAVFIDVRDVMINVTGDTANGWQSLGNVNAAQYDLLRLVNDDDTLLTDAEIPAGRVEQIRLVLGPNNYVVVNGQQYPLATPSAEQSGLKLNIHQDVEAGLLYQLVMDFDVARSIIQTGNGNYKLKPLIRTTLIAAGGSIKGAVTPTSFQTLVKVFIAPGGNPSDTIATTFTDAANGGYLIRGLPAGTYSIDFQPTDATWQDSVRSGINVTNGVVTIVDTMRLHQ